MPDPKEIKELIIRQGLLPLFFYPDKETCVQVTRALYGAGIRAIEFTNRGEQALDNFIGLKAEAANLPGLKMGIGTIKTEAQANQYIKAGADFIVCPVVHTGVARLVQDAGLLWIPGCMTPTEVNAAEMAGAHFVKIFPGNVVGPSLITAITELFPSLSFMPTGGVELNEQNLQGWFRAGAVAVGMGSKLITKEILEQKKYTELAERTREAISLVNANRNKT